MALVLKTAVDPPRSWRTLRAAIRDVDPEQPIADVRTMEEWVVAVAAAAADADDAAGGLRRGRAVLSAIGIYGVLAFGVAQRMREFGIRQALGADGASILSLVLKQGMRTAGVGARPRARGVAGARRATCRRCCSGCGAHDAAVFAGVAALLFAVALAACYMPARRATRIEPMTALRDS